MVTCMEVTQLKVTPRRLASRQFPIEMLNTVLDKDTGELTEYQTLTKNPKYRNLYGKSYIKDLGHLLQGILGQVEGTNTILFINKEDMPNAR